MNLTKKRVVHRPLLIGQPTIFTDSKLQIRIYLPGNVGKGEGGSGGGGSGGEDVAGIDLIL